MESALPVRSDKDAPSSLGAIDRPGSSISTEESSPDSRDAPFFIVGSGRSGTTLLRLIMLGHSRLHIPPETHFIRTLVNDIPLDQPLQPDQVAAAVERIVAHPRWRHMGVTAEQFRSEAIGKQAPRLADVLNLIYRGHLQVADKPRFGDKTPDYVCIVPHILKIYPDARFIHLIRDGRDVAISYARVGWGQAYHGPRFEWTRAVRATLAYRQTAFADRILEVRFEQMVRDLEGTVRRICAFIGEVFEPDMLNWHDRIDSIRSDEPPDLHPKLPQPILPDEAAAWRRRLSAVECFLIEASQYRDLEAVGYELRFAGPLWRPCLTAAGAMMHILAPLLDRILPALLRRNYLPRPLYI